MRISNTWVKIYTILSLFMAFVGILISFRYQSFTNLFNISSIIFFILGMLSLTYETNRISLSHLPRRLAWKDLGKEYALSPSPESENDSENENEPEKYGLLKIILEKSGFLKILLNEIIINTPNYFEMQIKEGYSLPSDRIKQIPEMTDRTFYNIPMKKELRKDWVIGVDFRVEKPKGDNIHNEEIDVTVKYDLKIRNHKLLGCENTISIS